MCTSRRPSLLVVSFHLFFNHFYSLIYSKFLVFFLSFKSHNTNKIIRIRKVFGNILLMNCNIWNLFMYLDYINLVFLCLQGKMGMPGFPGVNGIPVSKYNIQLLFWILTFELTNYFYFVSMIIVVIVNNFNCCNYHWNNDVII